MSVATNIGGAIMWQQDGVRHGRLLCMTLAVLLLCGCGNVQLQWKEEVQLQDGVQLVVERTATGEKVVEPGGPESWEQTSLSVTFGQVPTGMPAPPMWQAAYVPMVLDYDAPSRTWTLVAAFYRCETWYALGRPIPPYVQFQSRDGTPWRQTSIEKRLIGRPANMLTGPRSDGEPDLVTLEYKARSNLSAAPLFRTILPKWGVEELNFCDAGARPARERMGGKELQA